MTFRLFRRSVAQRGVRQWGPLTDTLPGQTLTPSALTLAISLPAAVVLAGAVVLSAGSVTVAVTAPSTTGGVTTTRAAGAQTLAITAPVATRTVGAVTVPAGAQTLSVSAPSAVLLGTPQSSAWVSPRRPIAQRGLQRWGPPPQTVLTATTLTRAAGVQTLAITAPPVTVVAGAITRPAGSQTLALTAPLALGWAAGPQTITASTPTVALTAPAAVLARLSALPSGRIRTAVIPRGLAAWGPPPIKIGAGTTSVLAGAPALAITAPLATLQVGTSTRPAGTQTLAVTVPIATVPRTVPAGSVTLAVTAPPLTLIFGTTRIVSGQIVVVAAPSASLIVGAVSPAAGVQTLVVTAPLAISVPTIFLPQADTPQTVALSAPPVTIGTQFATLAGGAQTVVVTVPTARLAGAAELPANIIVATLVSLAPHRTLAMDADGGYAAGVLKSAPVAYWRLDESAGPTAVDATGHGHDGTYQSGVTLGQPGALAEGHTAIACPGTTIGRVILPATALAAITGPITIEGCINTNTLALPVTGHRMWWAGANIETWAGIFVSGQGRVDVSLKIDGLQRVLNTNPFLVTIGQWYHVAITWGGSGTPIRIYVDGSLKATSAAFTGTLDLGVGTGLIGGYVGSGAQALNWDGSLDEVALYDRALTATEIVEHARRRLARNGQTRTLEFLG